MPQPLEFRKHVVGWVGGRDGVLARAREMLATTHPLTRAGDASRIDPDSARRHAVDVVLAATLALTEPHLAEHVERHIEATIDEHEMLEGYRPDDAELEDLVVRALAGETTDALDDMRPLVRRAEDQRRGVGEVVAEAICTVPVADKARSLAFIGVTAADVEALADLSRTTKREPGEIRAWDTVEIVGVDPWEEPEPAAVGASDVKDLTANKPTTPATPRQRRDKQDATAAPLPGETPLATACVAALDVLCRKSSATEEDVARAIGTSRAQMNKLRYRKVAWMPTKEQARGLRTLLSVYVDTLNTAFLHEGWSGRELS